MVQSHRDHRRDRVWVWIVAIAAEVGSGRGGCPADVDRALLKLSVILGITQSDRPRNRRVLCAPNS